jgi:hypothetical protein
VLQERPAHDPTTTSPVLLQHRHSIDGVPGTGYVPQHCWRLDTFNISPARRMRGWRAVHTAPPRHGSIDGTLIAAHDSGGGGRAPSAWRRHVPARVEGLTGQRRRFRVRNASASGVRVNFSRRRHNATVVTTGGAAPRTSSRRWHEAASGQAWTASQFQARGGRLVISDNDGGGITAYFVLPRSAGT